MNSYSTSNIQQKLCLATVSSKDYWPGTKSMIKSFLHYNKWFNGDIVIISDDKHFLHKTEEISSQTIYPSELILKNVDKLCQSIPMYKMIKSRFYLFEIFNLAQYDRVIYFDSDIVFTSAISPYDILKPNIGAVLDPWHFRGYSREKNTCLKIKTSLCTKQNCYPEFYNSGFISVCNKYLNRTTYQQLCKLINIDFLEHVQDNLADEPILNHYFKNEFTSLNLSYNCPVHLIAEGLVKTRTKTLHFTGPNKPWKLPGWLKLTFRFSGYFKFLVLWFKERYR